jgi:hypothetical protein
MLIVLAAPPENTRGPRYMQEALAAVHQANHRRPLFSLEYAWCDGRIGLFCRVPDQIASIVLGPLKAKYPNCTLAAIENEQAFEPSLPATVTAWSAELALIPDLFPLLRHSQFEDAHGRGFEDPIDALLQAVAPDEHTWARIQIVVRPTSRLRHWRARRAVAKLDAPWLRASDDRT